MYLVHMSVMCCSFSRPIAFGVYDVREESSSELPASLDLNLQLLAGVTVVGHVWTDTNFDAVVLFKMFS